MIFFIRLYLAATKYLITKQILISQTSKNCDHMHYVTLLFDLKVLQLGFFCFFLNKPPVTVTSTFADANMPLTAGNAVH